jgi:hypothetical protein
VRGHGCEQHGKYEGDGLALNHRNEADKLTLNWTPGEDVPEAKCEGAEQLYLHMNEHRGVEMSRQRRARLTGGASVGDSLRVARVRYHFLSVAKYNATKAGFRRFKTVKARKGEGSKSWYTYRFREGHPLELQAGDTLCGCSGCMASPPMACLGTHRAGPLRPYTLEETKDLAQADSSPHAEDEQRPTWLLACENALPCQDEIDDDDGLAVHV